MSQMKPSTRSSSRSARSAARRRSVSRAHLAAAGGGYGFGPDEGASDAAAPRRDGWDDDGDQQIEAMLDSIKRLVREDLSNEADGESRPVLDLYPADWSFEKRAAAERERRKALDAPAASAGPDADDADPRLEGDFVEASVDVDALADALLYGARRLRGAAEAERSLDDDAASHEAEDRAAVAEEWDEFSDLLRKADMLLGDETPDPADLSEPMEALAPPPPAPEPDLDFGAERADPVDRMREEAAAPPLFEPRANADLREMMAHLKTRVDFGADEAPEASAEFEPERIDADFDMPADEAADAPPTADDAPAPLSDHVQALGALSDPADAARRDAPAPDQGADDVAPPAYDVSAPPDDLNVLDRAAEALDGARGAARSEAAFVETATPADDAPAADAVSDPSTDDMTPAADASAPPSDDAAPAEAPTAEPSVREPRRLRARAPVEEIFTLPPTLAQKDALKAINDLVRRRVDHFVATGVEPGKLVAQPIPEIVDKVGVYQPAGGAAASPPPTTDETPPSAPDASPREQARASLLGGLSDGFTPAPIEDPAPASETPPAVAADPTKATLAAWLESNLPRLVESLVREEVGRISDEDAGDEDAAEAKE